MTYYYKNQDISSLLSGTGGTTPGYINFPNHGMPSTNIEKPLSLSYQYNGTDISNYCTAFTLQYNSSSSFNPGIDTPIMFKHVSVVCVGGGGGGGGGGGRGAKALTGSYTNGGSGAPGGAGGYASIFEYPFNSGNMTLTIGSGGYGGGGGGQAADASSKSGGNGSNGGSGNGTYLYMNSDGGSAFIVANGGTGGGGGGAGNANNNNPSSNAIGTDGNGIWAPTYTGYSIPTPGYTPNYFTGYSYGGSGGSGGKSSSSANGGTPGGNGYAQVWFLYE